MSTRQVTFGLGLLTTAVLLAACSSAANSSAPVAAATAAAPAHGRADATTAGSAGPGSRGIAIGVPPTADVQRSVRAGYTVPSGTFLTSFDGVIARAVELGGYVAASATRPAPDGRIVAGSVTLEIPATSIAIFLNGMPAAFTASSIDFASVDHYAAFVDVNAERLSARAHLHALDVLLAKASTLGDITTVEQQIAAVQIELDTYQGQLNGLSASVEMATTTVALSERGTTLVVSAPGPVNGGLSAGWHNAIQVTSMVLEALVTALPVLVIVALGLAVWRLAPRLVRRTPRSLP
jgi:Domain of unknown function (DUF4349)